MSSKKSNKVVIGFTITLAVVLVFSFGPQRVLATNVLNTVTYPVFRFFSSLGSALGNIGQMVASINNLSSENKRLQQEVARLQSELSKSAENEVQIAELKKVLKWVENKPQIVLSQAQIISKEPSNFISEVWINKGSLDGIKEGLNVVWGEGMLVGVVGEVQLKTSQVIFTTSSLMAVPSLDQQTRASGIIKGSIGYGLHFEDIPQDAKVKKGDTIISSGLGGDIEKGLVIGYVEEIDSKQNQIYQTAKIRPAVEFKKLEQVYVIMR